MHEFSIEEDLEKILQKILKKDRSLYEQIMKKIEEIVNSSDIEHYKNLKYSMKNLKRVHIGHFVLVFCFIREEDKVVFWDFDHHDIIYKKYLF